MFVLPVFLSLLYLVGSISPSLSNERERNELTLEDTPLILSLPFERSQYLFYPQSCHSKVVDPKKYQHYFKSYFNLWITIQKNFPMQKALEIQREDNLESKYLKERVKILTTNKEIEYSDFVGLKELQFFKESELYKEQRLQKYSNLFELLSQESSWKREDDVKSLNCPLTPKSAKVLKELDRFQLLLERSEKEQRDKILLGCLPWFKMYLFPLLSQMTRDGARIAKAKANCLQREYHKRAALFDPSKSLKGSQQFSQRTRVLKEFTIPKIGVGLLPKERSLFLRVSEINQKYLL